MSTKTKPFEIKYEQDAGFQYLALETKGAFSQIPNLIPQLMQLVAEQNLFSSMRGPVFVAFYSDPKEVATEEEHFWAVGFPCAEYVNFKAPLKLKEREASFVAKCMVYGPYETLAQQYPKIEEAITNDGYHIQHWSFEWYLEDVRQVKPEDLRTELWIDITKSD